MLIWFVVGAIVSSIIVFIHYVNSKKSAEKQFRSMSEWNQKLANNEDMHQGSINTFNLIQKVAIKGDSDAQFELGVMYQEGKDVRQQGCAPR